MKLSIPDRLKGKRLYREVWKDIEGYENLYQVSNLGRVRSLDRKSWNGNGWFIKKGTILKLNNDTKGYPFVWLQVNGKKKCCRVHRLVMMAFKPCEGMENLEIDHINCVRDDNRIENLRWCDRKSNMNNELTKKHISESLKNSECNKGENNPMFGSHRTGEDNPFYGHHHSEETKKKLSETRKGTKLSEEAKDKISKANKGKVVSEETRKKMSKKCRCIETNIVYSSIKEASEKTGICATNISYACNGKYKTSGGFHWEYVTD